MKRVTLGLVFLSFMALAFAKDNSPVGIKIIKVKTPFSMPDIKVPDFSRCKQLSIIDFGAVKGDKEKTGRAIAKAIDVANKMQGGVVVIPEGEWLTGKIHFKSNVNLHLNKGAVLLFSENPADYLPAVPSSWEGMECYNYSPLIYAYECKNIAITGEGEIKAKMDTWKKWFARPKAHMESIKRLYNLAAQYTPVKNRQMVNDTANLRPQFIQFNRSENILIEGISITNSPFWTIHPYLSKHVVIRSVKIWAHGHNNDGIDPEMSQNVLIENCTFDQGDDAIAIKSGRNPEGWRLKTPSKNIVIRNCTVKNGHQLVALGSELSGGIENVFIDNCTVLDGAKLNHLIFIKTNERMGGYVKNIYASNIKSGKIDLGILGIETDVLYQWRTLVPTVERRLTPIKDIHLDNVHASNVKFISRVLGQEELPVANIFLNHVSAGTVLDKKHIQEHVVNFRDVNQIGGNYDAIYSGVPWFDDQGEVVSAHGANIIKDNDKYYLFGEAHTDTSNAFVGFKCYSSVDLYNWKFERVALPVQQSGKLGPNRVGERVKVMKCPQTGTYMMYMHVDTLGYKDQFVGYATSNTIAGPYTFQGPLLLNGKAIRKWDMGTFQDQDGSGYILIHGGEIYKLASDYKSVVEQVNKNMTTGFESPAMFRKGSVYYFLGSHLTSWEKNDNYYYTANSLGGPWTSRGFIAPEGSLTWNSQTTFVLPIGGAKDTTYLFMGDRWSFPKQASAATYVWQPLSVSDTSVSIPKYIEAWELNTSIGQISQKGKDQRIVKNTDKSFIKYNGNWKNGSSDTKGDSFSVKFEGTGIGLHCLLGPDKGYARVILQNEKGAVLLSSTVDMYSMNLASGLKFLSPKLPKAKYVLIVSVMGERPNWSDKKKTNYGSKGYFISVDKVVINK